VANAGSTHFRLVRFLLRAQLNGGIWQPMRQVSRPRLIGYLLVAVAFVGVWLGAKQIWLLLVTVILLMPAQLLTSRAILAERGYQAGFAWFGLLLGPMGLLLVLGFPALPTRSNANRNGSADE
jgi:hypothetical protein